MSEPGPAAPPGAQQEPPAPDAAQAAQAPPPPKHLYDAVATQRDHVLDSFGAQRNAILQAVAEQRQAAMAPIHTVQARQAAQAAASSAGVAGTGGRGMPPVTRQQLVAADIVAALKALVAEEVRVQLRALLELADARHAGGAPAPGRQATGTPDHGSSEKDFG